MRFAPRSAVAVAMASSFAAATQLDERLLGLDLSGLDKLGVAAPIDAHVSLDVDLSNKVLAAGVMANPHVGSLVDVKEDLKIEVICHECFVHGDIDAKVSLANIVPALDLTLTDVEAKLDLEIFASDATQISVNLLAAPALDLPFLGLDLKASVYVDLVIGLSTAIDVRAGLDVKLADKAEISTNILSGDILSTEFTGLSVDVMPIEVRIGCTELHANIRVRVEVDAGLDTNQTAETLPILAAVPAIGAGLELVVFVNLVEYIGLFCPDPQCPLPEDSYGLNVGAKVGLDLSVEDLLHIHLAPEISTGLLSAPTVTHCTTTPPSNTGSVPGGESNMSVPGNNNYPITTAAPNGPEQGNYPTDASNDSPVTAPPGQVVSTVTQTATYTITTCGATVANCPGNYQNETTIIHTTIYTTVCPATANITEMAPMSPQSQAPAAPVLPHPPAVPCHEVNTFTPPVQVAYPSSQFPAMPAAPVTTEVPAATSTWYATITSSVSAQQVQPMPAQTYPAAPFYPAKAMDYNNATTIMTTTQTLPMGTGYLQPTSTYMPPTAGASKQVASGVLVAVAGVFFALL